MHHAQELFKATKKASAKIRRLSSTQKSAVLNRLAEVIENAAPKIQTENEKDLARMDVSDAKYDRLLLTQERINTLASSLREVAVLPDPSGEVISEKILANGLLINKIAVPMGVIGIIYESRPNVTIDVASLCLRSGNACILKGGKEAHFSNECLVGLIHQVLEEFALDKNAVTLLPANRTFTEELLKATRFVDLIIPRGSENLIQYVRSNSLIPTIETGAGVCHTYVEKTADLDKAAEIVVNARASRPSVCNSCDCVLIDESILADFIPKLKKGFEQYNVEVVADKTAFPHFKKAGFQLLQLADESAFGKEWLDFKISVKTVAGIGDALAHIETFSSRHSEAILTDNQELATIFLNEVDAATVYHNASTRFTDGGQFGLGAEIGISTQKLHARGPFALEKLVTEKWIIKGNGQVRW